VDEVDLASRVSARVKRVAVQLGQTVKAGDLLVEFEDDIIAAKRKQAEAMTQAAKSRSDIAEDAVRPEEKTQIKSAVIAAKKQMQLAKSSFERAKLAFQEGAISQQALDEVEFKFQAATENYNATAAKEKMAKVGARPEEKMGAQALLSQAQNALAEVDAYVKDMSLTSPIDGEVFQILNHEGELVPAGYPVVTLLKTSNKWVAFHASETQLKNFGMGQPLTLEVPSLDNVVLKGQVSFISPMATFANRTQTQDRGAVDLKTFELRANISDSNPKLRPGMTVFIQP
jgi:HlyD family secretion protein